MELDKNVSEEAVFKHAIVLVHSHAKLGTNA